MTTFDSLNPTGDSTQPIFDTDFTERSHTRKGQQGSVTTLTHVFAPRSPLVGTILAESKSDAKSDSKFSPELLSLAYPLGCGGIIPFYFDHVQVSGQHHLPTSGPVILAPTHRSRWDALLVPYAAGYHVTGRHLRFMVTSDEMRGVQGWMIQRLGGFSVDVKQPAIASLRQGVKLLQDRETLVLFPEGNIFRGSYVNPLKPGLARLALQAAASEPNLDVKILPIYMGYSDAFVPWRSRVNIRIGAPLSTADYGVGSVKQNARQLTQDLREALTGLAGNLATPRLRQYSLPRN